MNSNKQEKDMQELLNSFVKNLNADSNAKNEVDNDTIVKDLD